MFLTIKRLICFQKKPGPDSNYTKLITSDLAVNIEGNSKNTKNSLSAMLGGKVSHKKVSSFASNEHEICFAVKTKQSNDLKPTRTK